MSLEQLRSARLKTVGTKETMKAVQNGKAATVFVAEDAEARVIGQLEQLCVEQKIPVVRVASMRELGRLCSIEVGAASAAIIED